jgi:hypothetical protein
MSSLTITPVVAVVDSDAPARTALVSLIRSAGWMARAFASAREFLGSPLPTRPTLTNAPINTNVQSLLMAIAPTVFFAMDRSTPNGCRTCDSLLRAGQEPPLASHLVTPRRLYSHHGIYVGDGRVIHYAGLAHGWRRGPVEEVSLESFAHGCDIRVRNERAHFERSAVVARARSRLGERSYRVLTNNCEHFCAWALLDESRSAQIEGLYESIEQHVQWLRRCVITRAFHVSTQRRSSIMKRLADLVRGTFKPLRASMREAS